jgi:hypothetical protein
MKINRELIWIRIQLTAWGRLCRAMGIGYPHMSTTERARVGRGGVSDGPSLPDDLAEIDYEVAVAPIEHKIILIEAYTKGGHWTEHAVRLGMNKDKYYSRKESAELYLNTQVMGANRMDMLRAS